MGEIPESICNIDIFWISFPYFDIDNNQLCPPYPDCISEEDIGYQDTSECEEPSLCDEEIEVELWGECYNIEETTSLFLSEQGLTGEISPQIGDLINLTSINLSLNDISGEIPSEIGNLTNLRYLYLQNNQLTGEIPSSLGNLTNLIYLILDENQLSGSIPSSIGNLINVSNLRLNDNSLSGEIPSEIGSLINLNTLCLQNNQLSGEIPESICEVFPLSWGFSISNNNLCPPYPDCGGGSITSEEQQNTSECVECPDSIEGDTNYDGYVNILDIITVVNCILSNDCNECFDINYDSSVDILDIISMINMILEP